MNQSQATEKEDATSARTVIELCKKALAEELSAWEIDPPLAHVKAAHDACVEWLRSNAALTGRAQGASE